MGMGKRQKRQQSWLYDPPADETPRERQYRLGMLGLLDWMAGKILEQLLAESAANHGVLPESMALVPDQEASVSGGEKARREVDAQLRQREASKLFVFDLCCVSDGVCAFDTQQGFGMTRPVRTVEGIVVV